jgi:hypothetical protein
MVVEELYSILTEPISESVVEKATTEQLTAEDVEPEAEQLALSSWAEAAFTELYSYLATTLIRDADGREERVMGVKDVEAWLTVINGQVGRGSEFRAAAAYMESSIEPLQHAEEEGREEEGDKHEGDGVEGDNNRLLKTGELPAKGHLTLAAFLSVYRAELNQGKVWGVAHDLAALGRPPPLDPSRLYRARFDRLYLSGPSPLLAVKAFHSDRALPNELHPSDHLPVMALFDWQ